MNRFLFGLKSNVAVRDATFDFSSQHEYFFDRLVIIICFIIMHTSVVLLIFVTGRTCIACPLCLTSLMCISIFIKY